jgi:large subunit ribosomal protein L35
MPKEKTHKGLKKRVKVTATGKVKRWRTGGSHLLSNKSGKWRRKFRGSVMVKGIMAEMIKGELLSNK